jgi:hypothetical protein
MGERGDGVEPEHGARSLDRMQGAEDPPDELRIPRAFLQDQERSFQLGQKLGRFLPERSLVRIHHRTTSLAAGSCARFIGSPS